MEVPVSAMIRIKRRSGAVSQSMTVSQYVSQYASQYELLRFQGRVPVSQYIYARARVRDMKCMRRRDTNGYAQISIGIFQDSRGHTGTLGHRLSTYLNSSTYSVPVAGVLTGTPQET